MKNYAVDILHERLQDLLIAYTKYINIATNKSLDSKAVIDSTRIHILELQNAIILINSYSELNSTAILNIPNMCTDINEVYNIHNGKQLYCHHNGTYSLIERNGIDVCCKCGYPLSPDSKQTAKELIMQKEFIICAANHYNDGIKHTHSPKNIESGFVICGRRHHNCINMFAQVVRFPYSEEAYNLLETEIQGFLTSTDRFVTRKEAYTIAFNADQIIGPNKGYPTNHIGLCSEDLY